MRRWCAGGWAANLLLQAAQVAAKLVPQLRQRRARLALGDEAVCLKRVAAKVGGREAAGVLAFALAAVHGRRIRNGIPAYRP